MTQIALSNKTSPKSAPAPRWTAQSASLASGETCAKIAPLWPLRHFVAVNPFLGHTQQPFAEACQLFAQVAPGGMQMDLGYYREKLAYGEIENADLDIALSRTAALGNLLPAGLQTRLKNAADLRAALTADAAPEDGSALIATFSETIDRLLGTRWSDAVIESLTGFCSALLDEGQSAWRSPWREDAASFYAAWKEYASIDRQLDSLGLAGFRKAAAALPESADEALAWSLEKLDIDQETAPLWLHRALLTVRGWAGYLQYQNREKVMAGGHDDGRLAGLLAARVSMEAILRDLFADLPSLEEHWPPVAVPNAEALPRQTTLAYLAQMAHEHAWERKMRKSLAASGRASVSSKKASTRPSAHAVFCIDVRSEVFRRALESIDPSIRTSGFAGFFGLPIRYQALDRRRSQAQCPVLLAPQFEVHECHEDHHRDVAVRRKIGQGWRLAYGWNAFKTSAISCFSFVETSGLAFGGSLVRDSFALKKSGTPTCTGRRPSLDAISATDRVALARGMMKNLGLTEDFARLVLLCGHGSETANNPYGSGLDCGACGGHAGDANARVGAALLNDPQVRARLAADHGIRVPEDTWFLAGLHNTTTDDITLFDLEQAPASHRVEIDDLRSRLAAAGEKSRGERALRLGLPPTAATLDHEIRHRARDWSQVRPEWGLAGNAAFVAAPRARTQEANLAGRVFLHDYDHHGDPDNSILELIMTAPMVVANWINLQYYGSTVNNAFFGSGNKVIHNVVGTVGACLGNLGDLQTGLPFQSVHDGNRYMHEPLRLHVFLEAPLERIDAVIAKHGGVRDLIDHQWLHVFAILEDGSVSRRLPYGGWE